MERISVLEEDEGTRLDILLSDEIPDLSRSYIQRLIKDQMVTVNGSLEKSKYPVKTGDLIELKIPEPKTLSVEPQNIPLEIVFEDEDLLVVNKPQDMVVHPAPGNYQNTLVNALLYHCKGRLSSINGIIRPGIVHRIDKDTSGLLVVAKNDFVHRSLAQQLKEHTITRKYHAITLGNIKENKATIEAPIGRNPNDRLKMAVVNGGKEAITHVKVLERFKDFTYIEAQLQTGRTHQIRVHLSFIKHPLLGDDTYGGKTKKFNLKGQVLHAKVLGFNHPTSGEYMEFQSSLPIYFDKLLTILK
nr:RluA family pseudouridine synthase [Alkaliphilus pronyensis]